MRKLIAIACLLASPALSIGNVGAMATVTALPAKLDRAARRQKLALPTVAPLYRRSRNPRHRRPLRGNRLHISRRVRRRHRRRAA